MYEWLEGALDDASCLVTANRRLARVLREAWAGQRVAAGVRAWRTPDIQPWHGWLNHLAASAERQDELPVRINAHQSQLLWDRCLRKELDDSATGLPALVRLARDAWQRLADARVGIRELARSARSEDQRLFAAAAGRYLAVLEHEGWVDDAGLGELALTLVRERRVPLQERYVFAGFDRLRPSAAALQSALREQGCEVVTVEAAVGGESPVVQEFEQRDAELRTAGAWARGVVERRPGARVAVIVQGLENSAVRDLRLLRDGFAPGWQYGPQALRDAVDISYGQRLADYPAVTIALLALNWLVRELSSTEVSMLLLSRLLGDGEMSARSRCELHLRRQPDRGWTPSMVTSTLRGREDAALAADWLGRLAAFTKRRRELPAHAAPAEWALIVDATLADLGWPGPGSQSSESFQLFNRWRELLNEFARLDLVSPSMRARSALAQLELMAAETLFQPESRDAAVHLMGPLEAAGAEFDAVWICGLTAQNWPPASSPTALIAKTLQRQHEMPDATPEDTRAWAAATLQRLTAAAPDVVCSYALVEDDAEQAATDLLGHVTAAAPPPDPGWHAASLVGRAGRARADDPAPPVVDEKVSGGAMTLQQQMSEPFSAFVGGRLGARPLERQALGVPAWLRGNLVHDTLYRIYQGLPSAATLRAIGEDELGEMVRVAARAALQRHDRNTDPVLHRLLELECARIEALLVAFVKADRARGDFSVAAVEGGLEFRHGPLQLALRFDRLDRYPDGGIGIIDYKTGAAKKLLRRDGSAQEAQLFVYAMACDDPVVALALANIDAREIGFSGAGRGFTDESDWPDLLASVTLALSAACDAFVAGDVRLVAQQGAAAARPLNLLSRYTELRRDG